MHTKSITSDWLKNVSVEVAEITSTEELKYLGTIIDDRLNFKAYLKHATEKASIVHASLKLRRAEKKETIAADCHYKINIAV